MLPRWLSSKQSTCNAGAQEMRIQYLDWEDTLEEEMATHSSVLSWRIPGTEEPSGLPSMGSHRVGHDWSDLAAAAATLIYSIMWFSYIHHYISTSVYPTVCSPPKCSFHLSPWASLVAQWWRICLHCRDTGSVPGSRRRRKWQPTPVYFLENPRDRGAWWVTVYGVPRVRHNLSN